jgi:hypothetical protein
MLSMLLTAGSFRSGPVFGPIVVGPLIVPGDGQMGMDLLLSEVSEFGHEPALKLAAREVLLPAFQAGDGGSIPLARSLSR